MTAGNEPQEKAKAWHWLVVGYVSPDAQAWITETGGQALPLQSEPPLVAVALAYNPTGAWVWSHGRQEHRQGIEYWNTGEIQEASSGITLQYGSISGASAEYCSAETTYLLLPDETFDPETRQVKEPDTSGQPFTSASLDDDAALGADEHPF